MTANTTQAGKKAVPAPAVVTIDASTGEVDWLELLAALLDSDEDGSVLLAGSGSAPDGGGQSAPGTDSPSAESGEEAVSIGSASGILAEIFTASHLQPPEVLNGSADSAWANLRLGDLETPPEVIGGHGVLSGPGFRTVGLFLYFDENGGGVDGTETLFAEYRPAAGGMSEIIFF